MLPCLYGALMSYAGQRKIAFNAGFNDALFGRPSANPYNDSTVPGSVQAYDEGYELGGISDIPPRGATGATGPAGASGPRGDSGANGSNGTNGNQHFVGNGTPAGGLGNDNDVYTDADTGDIYLKVTGSWVLQGNGGSVTLTVRSDTIDPDAVPQVTYRGDALPGTLTSAALWRVQRLTVQSDSDLAIVFADGDDLFDNIWDNRLSLSYS